MIPTPTPTLQRHGARSLGLSGHVGPTAGHIIGLQLPPQSLNEVVQRLADAQVHVSVRGVNLRVSPYLFNDLADVTRLLDMLAVAL
jgi:selenocysteine lyase/cysteine desulfurase